MIFQKCTKYIKTFAPIGAPVIRCKCYWVQLVRGPTGFHHKKCVVENSARGGGGHFLLIQKKWEDIGILLSFMLPVFYSMCQTIQMKPNFKLSLTLA